MKTAALFEVLSENLPALSADMVLPVPQEIPALACPETAFDLLLALEFLLFPAIDFFLSLRG